MQDQKILNKTITISEVVMKQTTGGNKYAIKDHEGRTFNFFTTKKDGTDTSVYAQFKNMELEVGSTVMIGYVEEEFNNKDGKKVISKKIINFRETNGQPTQTASHGKSSTGEASTRSQSHSGDAFGHRLAVQGHINALLSNPSYYGTYPVTIANLVKEAIAIEDEAEKQLNPSKFRQTVQQHASNVVDEDLPINRRGFRSRGDTVLRVWKNTWLRSGVFILVRRNQSKSAYTDVKSNNCIIQPPDNNFVFWSFGYLKELDSGAYYAVPFKVGIYNMQSFYRSGPCTYLL